MGVQNQSVDSPFIYVPAGAVLVEEDFLPLWTCPSSGVSSAILTVVPQRVEQLLGSPGCWVQLPGLMLEMLNLWSDD